MHNIKKYFSIDQGWYKHNINDECNKFCSFVDSEKKDHVDWVCGSSDDLSTYSVASFDKKGTKCEQKSNNINMEKINIEKINMEDDNFNKSKKVLKNKTSDECKKLCELDNECISIDYNLENRTCTINTNQIYKDNQLKNPTGNIHIYYDNNCIDSTIFNKNNNLNNTLIGDNNLFCNSNNSNTFYIDSDNPKNIQLAGEPLCFENNNDKVIVNNCNFKNSKQEFIYDNLKNQIHPNDNLNKCITVVQNDNNLHLNIDKCTDNDKLKMIPLIDTFNSMGSGLDYNLNFYYIIISIIIIIFLIII